MGQGQERRRDYKGTRKLLEMMDMFIIWIVVMVSWVIRSYALILCSLLYAMYTSIKLLKPEKAFGSLIRS